MEFNITKGNEFETAIEVLESYLELLEEKNNSNEVSNDYNSNKIQDLSYKLRSQLSELSDLIKEELNNPIYTRIRIKTTKGLSCRELNDLEESISNMKGFKCSWLTSNHFLYGYPEDDWFDVKVEGNYYKTQSKFIEDVKIVINNLPINDTLIIEVED